ncbi:MAG: glutathione synthase [Candidatus Omnitrophica bacterium]|nr:glutathione synthase [Candidatus Omnitrophota bacterium]
MRIAFLLYPTHTIKVNEDSSFWIMVELQRRGHEVFYFEDKDLFWASGGPQAYLRQARLDTRKGYLPSPRPPRPAALADFQAIIIRKEPPFDDRYRHALQLLALLKDKLFINDPGGILAANEKLFILGFERFIPETLVTAGYWEARQFMKDLGVPIVVKPLDNKGGKGIFFTTFADRNFPSLFETATDSGLRKVMLQRFVSADTYGDKRLFLLSGEILGAFMRKPSREDFRANLSVGATMHDAAITKRDQEIVEAMRPSLAENGLILAGLDVIGKFLTEINVTSPAGIPEINHFHKTHPERRVVDFIEARSVGRKHL